MVARGISSAGDIITTTADGQGIGVMWNELQASIDLRNRRRMAIEGLLALRHRTW